MNVHFVYLYVYVCVCVCVQRGSGAKAVMGKMKSVFEVLVYSGSSAQREGQGAGEIARADTHMHTPIW